MCGIQVEIKILRWRGLSGEMKEHSGKRKREDEREVGRKRHECDQVTFHTCVKNVTARLVIN